MEGVAMGRNIGALCGRLTCRTLVLAQNGRVNRVETDMRHLHVQMNDRIERSLRKADQRDGRLMMLFVISITKDKACFWLGCCVHLGPDVNGLQ